MNLRDFFLRRPAGEISMLREPSLEGGTLRIGRSYSLDSSKVNVELARQLYRNTHDDYKLGAAFAKPIVNTLAGFMGAPHFQHADDDAQNALDEFFGWHSGRLLRVERNGIRDGDVYVQIYLKMDRLDNEPKIALRLIPPEWCVPSYDGLTGELSEFVIKWPVINYERDSNGELRERGKYLIRETLKPRERTLEIDSGSPPPGVIEDLRRRQEQEADDNAWGFIPIVHFKNEAEENQMFGSSDLEPVEPFMKIYHDVMLYSAEGAQLFARPKGIFKLKNVAKFLQDNFTAQQVAQKRYPFYTKELFFMNDQDDASYMNAQSGLEGTTLLLEFIYYCIVDVSQTPEFAFGTAVASSKASVSEQMPVLARNVRRKRGEYEDPFRELGSMYLAIASQVAEISAPESFRLQPIDWEEVTPRDDAAVATTLRDLVDALLGATDGSLMSIDAAIAFLREFVPSMLPYTTDDASDDERTRILRTRQLLDRLKGGNTENVPDPDERPDLDVIEGEG